MEDKSTPAVSKSHPNKDANHYFDLRIILSRSSNYWLNMMNTEYQICLSNQVKKNKLKQNLLSEEDLAKDPLISPEIYNTQMAEKMESFFKTMISQ